MKKWSVFFLAILFVVSLTACGSPAEQETSLPDTPSQTASTGDAGSTPDEPSAQAGKTLVVYFSWSPSGNTEKLAQAIQEQTGGDLLELVPVNAYPSDYTECTEVALKERDDNARPPIKDLPESIAEYDRVLIGYPIWWHTAPMIVGTFLEHYDFTGMDVYPFVQSASMNTEQFETSMEFVRGCANNATVHDGLFASASDTDAITQYLSVNQLAK